MCLIFVSHLINLVIRLNLAPSDRVPPIIRQGPANQTLAPGATAQLQCYVMGNPLPSIQWERDGQRILGNDERFSLMENGSLQITALQVLYKVNMHVLFCFLFFYKSYYPRDISIWYFKSNLFSMLGFIVKCLIWQSPYAVAVCSKIHVCSSAHLQIWCAVQPVKHGHVCLRKQQKRQSISTTGVLSTPIYDGVRWTGLYKKS